MAQEDEFALAVIAPFEFDVAVGCRKPRFGGFFHHHECILDQPAALAHRGQRQFRETLAIGWVKECNGKRLQRMRRAEVGGVTPENARHAAKP